MSDDCYSWLVDTTITNVIALLARALTILNNLANRNISQFLAPSITHAPSHTDRQPT